MGCWFLRDSGLAFHCLSTLKLLGLAGLANGYMISCTHTDVFSPFCDVTCANSVQLNVEVEEEKSRPIVCKYCKHMVGTLDPTADGWRVQKWSISITSTLPSLPTYSYSVQKWISARLLYLIENTAVRKFHIHTATPRSSETAPIPSLLIWVFTPDLLFSSSIPTPNRLDPTRSMKVFYQKQTWQPLKPGEPESAGIEDVEFPEDLYDALDDALQQSQRLLPPTAKKFQGWDVGLLERFEVTEAGMGHVGEGNANEKNGEGKEEDNEWGIPSEPVD
jgi:hypothetical protein